MKCMDPKNKKLLITGASGFLGFNVCQKAKSEWDVFGEMSFLEGSPRSATVISGEDSVVYSISWEKFSEFMESKPHIAVKLLLRFTEVLIKRLQFIDDAFTTIARDFAEVTAISSSGGQDEERISATVDFLLRTEGPWIAR